MGTKPVASVWLLGAFLGGWWRGEVVEVGKQKLFVSFFICVCSHEVAQIPSQYFW